jgi:sulfane dehydrogenase subunit SoxC
MVRDETSHYTDLMPDGTARMFTFAMEAKSLITFPSGGQRLSGPGFYEISGLAWSGRGRIERVEVSTDGGGSWRDAALQEPRLPIAFTRFRMPWNWDGKETSLVSRCTDETGYIQPSREELIAARGLNSQYHYNGTKTWKVMGDGSVASA